MKPLRALTILILALLLLIVAGLAWTAWYFGEAARQSEHHGYSYSIDLSYSTTIGNVTLLLPVPAVDDTPRLISPILNGTAYGVSPDWNVTVIRENGTPMLAIRADRMVPEYHGTPIAIGPGASVLPTTLVPGHEYSPDRPVLMPVTVAVMETSRAVIDTRHPIGHEPLLFPGGNFSPGSCNVPPCRGSVYNHPVPVYIFYTSDRPAVLSLRVSVEGSNSVWSGGWRSTTYADTLVLELNDGTRGWIEGEARLTTADEAGA
jgi:hypothetical protein